jgi:hypothetical protein
VRDSAAEFVEPEKAVASVYNGRLIRQSRNDLHRHVERREFGCSSAGEGGIHPDTHVVSRLTLAKSHSIQLEHWEPSARDEHIARYSVRDIETPEP